jgi:hypothetical protein
VHNDHDEDSLLLLEHKLKITLPYTFEPGALGGVLTDMVVAGGSVYAATGAIVYREALPTSTNSPITITRNAILVPAGGGVTSRTGGGGNPQLVAYSVG